MSIRNLDSTSKLPLTSEEKLALQTYNAECERGIIHSGFYACLMTQLRKLLDLETEQAEDDARKCPGSKYGGKSPRDPSFEEYHDFNADGKCRQCGMQLEREPE